MMVAPCFNVDGDSGRACFDSMSIPEFARVAALTLWEQASFQSEFSQKTGVKLLVQSRVQRDNFDD